MNLIKVYAEMKEYDKAKKVVARAISEFSGTPQEVQIMFAQSEMLIRKGEVKQGLNMLRKIQPDNPAYIESQKKQAQLYLDELKDRINYQRCYMEILDNDPSVDNYKIAA